MRRSLLVLVGVALAVVVASGIALADVFEGDEGPNNIQGTSGNDHIDGRGGNDLLVGMGGADQVNGGHDNDDLYGGRRDAGQVTGTNTVTGGYGNDLIFGDGGADELRGGPHDDTIYDALENDSAVDIVYGGDGADEIAVANEPASRDVVDCGDGPDTVTFDSLDDVAADCEVLGQQLEGGVAVPESEVVDEGGDFTIQGAVDADNRKDLSRMWNAHGGPPADDRAGICDNTENDRKAVVKAFVNPGSDRFVWGRDTTGAAYLCEVYHLDFNSSGHSTAAGYWNGTFHGVGERHSHGG